MAKAKEALAGLNTGSDVAALGGIQAIATSAHSDVKNGLTEAQVEKNREEYGANVLPQKKSRPFWEHLMDAFEDSTLRILVASAVFSTIFGFFVSGEKADIIQGVAIMLAVVIVSGVNSFQNWSKDREFESLAKIKADRPVQVIRSGKEVTISIYDVVVGDVVILNSGDGLPADGVLLAGFDVEVDQSSMTGESEPVKKGGSDPVLIGGCLMLEGEGRMLVTAVGQSSKMGQTVALVEGTEASNTPLQDRLEELAEEIGRFGTITGGLTFLVLTALWFLKPWEEGKAYTDILRFFIVGVTIVVVAVPEGLPLAVTISLAFSMRRMMKDKNLVRELQACETMGSATVIASDKTGTLTENRMTAVAGWVYGRHYERLDRMRSGIANPGAAHRLAKAIALNSTAELRIEGPRIEFIRNPSEAAMLMMLLTHLNVDYSMEREAAGPPLARRAFKKETKFMTSVYGPESRSEGCVVYTKGAPEIVLDMCAFTQAPNGATTPITPEVRFNLKESVESMARQGLRTLAVAYRRMPVEQSAGYKSHDDWNKAIASGAIESDMTLLALFGLADPLREGVANAVARCQSAGIRVMMVTGDHRDTAAHIATQCGILRPGGTVMEGPTFRGLSDDERKAACAHLAVLARSSPTDKHLLVTTLKGLGEVVAVTGDGTNDAPALRAADVGLAMGIAGTEVAKEASDIVILDDRFSSIVASVRWGRSIKENIRKFLTFQLTINMVALTLTFITACANGGSTDKFPITPVQLLWVNLIMDSFAALALATEPPSERLMDFAPQGKSERLITRTMYKNMLGHAVFQTALLLWITMTEGGARSVGVTAPLGSIPHHTMVFTTFVALQVFNLFNCRATHDEWNVLQDFGSSVIGQVIIAVIVIMQFVIVQFGGEITQTEPLTMGQWALCIGIGFLSVPVGYLLKLLPAVDKELRKLAPPHVSMPRGPLYGEGSNVRGAFVRAIAEAVEADASGVDTPLPGGPRAMGLSDADEGAASAGDHGHHADVTGTPVAAMSTSASAAAMAASAASTASSSMNALAASTSTSSTAPGLDRSQLARKGFAAAAVASGIGYSGTAAAAGGSSSSSSSSSGGGMPASGSSGDLRSPTIADVDAAAGSNDDEEEGDGPASGGGRGSGGTRSANRTRRRPARV